MKTLQLIFITLFTTFSLVAQTDTQANEVLDKVTKKLNSFSSFKLSYTLEQEDIKSGAKYTDKGIIYIKGDKYRIEYGTTNIYFDGSAMCTHLTDQNEATIITAKIDQKSSGNILNPKSFLLFYDKDFKFNYIQEEAIAGVKYHKIDLYPKDLKSNYSRIRILVNSATNIIYYVKIFTKDGNHFSFLINEFSPNIDLTDSSFTFDSKKNPNVEVIDLR